MLKGLRHGPEFFPQTEKREGVVNDHSRAIDKRDQAVLLKAQTKAGKIKAGEEQKNNLEDHGRRFVLKIMGKIHK